MGNETGQPQQRARGPSSEQAGSVTSDEMVIMGRVAAPFGIKGWLRVTPYTHSPEDLLAYSELWLRVPGGEWRKCAISEAKVQSRSMLMALKGVTDRTDAEVYCRMEVAVPRSHLPPLGQDEYYWRDLLGMAVFTTDGVDLGKVEQIVETGANDVLVVRGERDRWIPFLLDHYVVSINLSDRKITVDWDPEF